MEQVETARAGRTGTAILFVAPVIQTTVLGYAATTDVRNVPLVVADADRSTESRQLIARFDAFRRRRHTQRFGKLGDARNDRLVVGRTLHSVDEVLVDLDPVER